MNGTIISWNVTNWVTIVLMAAIGIAILGTVERIVLSYKQKG